MTLTFEAPFSSCPLCGGSFTPAHRLPVAGHTLTYDRCRSCGLVVQNPRLTGDAVALLYTHLDYWGLEDTTRSAYADYEAQEGLRRVNSLRRLRRIAQLAGVRGGRLLDVGGATGFFGNAARSMGYDVVCVEPASAMVALGRRLYPELTFVEATVEACAFPAEQFDVITFFGSDSCLRHPVDSFALMASWLKPGGVLAMNYQDFDHWIRKVFPQLKIAFNCTYNFTDESFAALFERLGFEIVHRADEWQLTSADHIARAVRWPSPPLLRRIRLPVPALSYRFVVARKR